MFIGVRRRELTLFAKTLSIGLIKFDGAAPASPPGVSSDALTHVTVTASDRVLSVYRLASKCQ